MAKDLEVDVVTQLNAAAKRPCILVEMGLSFTLRFAAQMINQTFPTGGDVYAAKAMKVSSFNQSLEGQIDRITVEFDNVSKDMAAYANTQDFRGKSLIVKRVYLDAIGNADNYVEVFNGTMEAITGDITRRWLPVTATSGKPLNRKALVFPYQRLCPHKFGDANCNTDGKADLTSLTATGTAEGGSTTTLIDTALTEAEDYWNYGKIKITKASIDYWRIVKNFMAATDTITFDVAMPFAVDSDCSYVVYKGCSKTWDACGANNNWGPSSDNTANSLGCIHISKKADSG